ncbi:hypothetical protein PSACC_02763 [Paramicrosporidium saccamoebae]|uniref:V-SNARE coiled-coil homology domain-containing protein n=1 Tax=Paramicrosporidium saccamoebae TaxID=1246581 RepID=A0A2H9TIK9_9FUNG|nr:hypothetical protein PSACC_02763 [Paramicrosporidium saccamoebae]
MSPTPPNPNIPLKPQKSAEQLSPNTAHLQDHVGKLVNVMQANLDTVIDRGDSLQSLAERSSALSVTFLVFVLLLPKEHHRSEPPDQSPEPEPADPIDQAPTG